MSLEEQISKLTSAIEDNTSVLKQVLAGQKAAISVIEEGKGSGTTTRTRRRTEKSEIEGKSEAKGDKTEAKEDKASKTEAKGDKGDKGEGKSEAKGDTSKGATEEQLVAVAKAYVSRSADEDEKKARTKFLTQCAASTGRYEDGEDAFMAGPKCKLTNADRTKVIFFIKRAFKLGMENVDFDAPYDFGGEPDQAVAEDTKGAPEEDEFDPLA